MIRREEWVGEEMAQQVKNLPAAQRTQEMQVRSRGLGGSPGERNGNPLQYSCLKNPMDGEPGGLQSSA